jgi:hypothetical protein
VIDPLQDQITCERDIPHLLRLGINTLVIGHFNPDANHNACLKLLQEAGLYLIIKLDEGLLLRVSGEPDFEWDYNLWERFKRIVDALQRYKNLSVYVAMDYNTAGQALGKLALQKALIRDVKAYIKTKAYGSMSVGGLVTDLGVSTTAAEFWSCGNHEAAADFIIVEPSQRLSPDGSRSWWCTSSSADYIKVIDRYREIPVPLVFHYGSNESSPHSFEKFNSSTVGMLRRFSQGQSYPNGSTTSGQAMIKA